MKNGFSKRRLPFVVIGLIAYLAALQFGTVHRRHLEADAKEASRIGAVALSGWAYAQRHDGAWPSMDPATPFAYAPDTEPASYALGGNAEGPVNDLLKGYVLGNLNREHMRRLEPVLSSDEFFYLGYAVDSEDQGLALIEALQAAPAHGKNLKATAGEGSAGSSTFYRLHNDLLEVLSGEDVAGQVADLSRFPVIIQNPRGDHMWVMFLDFHAERLPYPGPFPATERFITALNATRE